MINSKSNEQIKFIASLKSKKYREKYSKYIIEGVKLVGEMMDLEGVAPSESIVYSKDLLETVAGGKNLLEKIKEEKVPALEVSSEVFKYVSDTETPQGALIVKNIKHLSTEEKMAKISNIIKNNGKFLVLDKVQDAGNLGTIIRSAVTFGIDSVLCIKGTTDIYSPKVVRSTMGAIEKTNVFYVDEIEFKNITELLIDSNYNIVGTDLSAKKYLAELNKKRNIVFVMGNEANGISDYAKNLCTDLIKIPISNMQESLNVAVATGICLYFDYDK